jgi:hypothetical protein
MQYISRPRISVSSVFLKAKQLGWSFGQGQNAALAALVALAAPKVKKNAALAALAALAAPSRFSGWRSILS